MDNTTAKNLIKKRVREMNPYAVEPLEVTVKLDAMENPHDLPPALKKRVEEAVKGVHINRYPDPESVQLKQLIASRIGVETRNLLIGNGSDELIQILFTALGEPGDCVLMPSPTFSMYRIIATPLHLKVQEVSLTPEWEIEPESFIRSVQENRAKIIVLANPNNPTGNCFSGEAVKMILETAPGAVIIDEAYYDFSKTTCLHLLNDHPNLFILRTLSKIGMAGLRVGYMIGRPDVTAEIGKVRLPYNTNALSQTAARVILENYGEIESQIGKIIKERDRLFKGLSRTTGITPYPSKTNFILFRTEKDSAALYRGLIDKGVLVRSFGSEGRLKNHLRVTVGTGEENDRFLGVLSELV